MAEISDHFTNVHAVAETLIFKTETNPDWESSNELLKYYIFGIGSVLCEISVEIECRVFLLFISLIHAFASHQNIFLLYFKRMVYLTFCELLCLATGHSANVCKEAKHTSRDQRFMLPAASRGWHPSLRCLSVSGTLYSYEARRMMVDVLKESFIPMQLNFKRFR